MKIPYDFLLFWSISSICNLNCKYCIAKYSPNEIINKFQFTKIGEIISKIIMKRNNKKEIKKLHKNPVDIDSALNTLKKLNKTCRIIISGGEPFFVPNFIEICQKLTEEHYITIISNFTSKKIKNFCDVINREKFQEFFVSCHLHELKKRKLADIFMSNLEYCLTKGIKVSISLVGYPEYMDETIHYRDSIRKKGIPVFIQPYNGYYKNKKYPSSYTEDEIKLLQLDLDNFFTKRNYCIAGHSSLHILSSGESYTCPSILKSQGNIFNKIKLKEKPIKCPFDVCRCSPQMVDQNLHYSIINNYKN